MRTKWDISLIPIPDGEFLGPQKMSFYIGSKSGIKRYENNAYLHTNFSEESAKEQLLIETRNSFREIHSPEKFSGKESVTMTASAQGTPGLQPSPIMSAPRDTDQTS